MKVLFQKSLIGLTFFTVVFSSCILTEEPNLRKLIDLKGEWQFNLDTANIGIGEKWFSKKLTDRIKLPGTTDENKKGFEVKDSSLSHLTRLYYYSGAAWYRREVNIPQTWNNKHIELTLERTKVTKVWVDSVFVGLSNDISISQKFDLTGILKPGAHYLTIMVNNDRQLVPVGKSHAYSEDTQTNWNGILGRINLEASNLVRIAEVKTFPQVHNRLVKVQLELKNPGISLKDAVVKLSAEEWNSSKRDKIAERKYELSLSTEDTLVDLTYAFNPKSRLWNEFNPCLYKLKVTLINKEKELDNVTVNFGLAEFKTDNSQFLVNDLKVFLRGKNDACVFPITGYPPMDVEGWLRVFKIARMYGINYYRFHSWCPPEAAFLAADISGMYLQPELPDWSDFSEKDTFHTQFMYKEGIKILDSYGNHPSFIALSLGNELGGDQQIMKHLVDEFRDHDSRHLYAQGSNNFFWNPKLAKGDDYWTTFRTAANANDHNNDVRLSFSYADSKDGGMLNSVYPSTTYNFSSAIQNIHVPVIGHETGQYQIYPQYDEIPSYSGVLQARNLEIFWRKLEEAGMIDQAKDFSKASGKLAALCYRQEIETAIRTPGFAGFQLLDLQDYPGQGTALVGILNSLMIDKEIINPEEFREFCNEVVPLLIMPKYCWSNDETFNGQVQIANYGPNSLVDKSVHWSFALENDKEIDRGEFKVADIPQGKITSLGKIQVHLNSFRKAIKANVRISIDGTEYRNAYPVWIYPSNLIINIPPDVKIETSLDAKAIETLKNGGKVLLFPEGPEFEKKSIPGQFTNDFWNYQMFKEISEKNKKTVSPGTLGILINPKHPALSNFPTEFHTNWQWWSVIKNSHAVILDETERSYRPIVQVIDNIYRNHKLGLIFEFKVEKGKLLVCSADLPSIIKIHEAKQLYFSLIRYMDSKDFSPKDEITIEKLKEILY